MTLFGLAFSFRAGGLYQIEYSHEGDCFWEGLYLGCAFFCFFRGATKLSGTRSGRFTVAAMRQGTSLSVEEGYRTIEVCSYVRRPFSAVACACLVASDFPVIGVFVSNGICYSTFRHVLGQLTGGRLVSVSVY